MRTTTNKPTGTPTSNKKQHQGPVFPYRFTFELSNLPHDARPTGLNCAQIFCRWTVGTEDGRPRALEWNDQGKGKGATALSSDEPPRCCSESTPMLSLTNQACGPSVADAVGGIYLGLIAGHGWYSSPAGTEFLIRLVTDVEGVTQLRDEASFYEEYESLSTRENSRASCALTTVGSVSPLEFHGFFQNDLGNAAAIVLKSRRDSAPRPYKKMGKKARRRRG